MEQSYCVLNVKGFYQPLVDISKRYADYYNNRSTDDLLASKYRAILATTPLRPLDLESAKEFVLETLREIVSSRSAYSKTLDAKRSYVKLLFGIYDPTQIQKAHLWFVENFLCLDVVDHIYLDLTALVAPYVRQGSYEDWKVIGQGHTVALVGGRDYRVLEIIDRGYLNYDLNGLFGYVRQVIDDKYGLVSIWKDQREYKVKPSKFLNLPPIIAEGIQRRFPRIRFEGKPITDAEIKNTFDPSGHISPETLALVGIDCVESFLETVVVPALDTFGMYHLTRRLDDHSHYTGFISTSNILTIQYAEYADYVAPVVPPSLVKAEEEALVASFLNGDYLPPEDRIKAERLVMDRNLL